MWYWFAAGIDLVAVPDLAMPVPIGRIREFERDGVRAITDEVRNGKRDAPEPGLT
jgi:hypothetical protein